MLMNVFKYINHKKTLMGKFFFKNHQNNYSMCLEREIQTVGLSTILKVNVRLKTSWNLDVSEGEI